MADISLYLYNSVADCDFEYDEKYSILTKSIFLISINKGIENLPVPS